MTEPETVALLVRLLNEHNPFVHVRFGDGDVFFATNTGPKLTADGEEWTPHLRAQLMEAWRKYARTPRLLLGDLETYDVSDGCEHEWNGLRSMLEEYRADRLPDDPVTWVHMEALRAGRGHALPLYQGVSAFTGHKVFIGPERLHGAARMLGADHVVVPLHKAHEHAVDIAVQTQFLTPDLCLFAAGRGGKIMQAVLASLMPWAMQIDVGSGLDVLFTDLRRGTDGQVDVETLRHEYRQGGLLL